MAFSVKDQEIIELAHSRSRERTAELLNVLAHEIWPLMEDSSPISKTERERLVGLNPHSGV